MSENGPRWAIFEVTVLVGGLAVIGMFAAKGGFWQNLALGGLILLVAFPAIGALALVDAGPRIWSAQDKSRSDPDRHGTAAPEDAYEAAWYRRKWTSLRAFVVASLAAGGAMLWSRCDFWQDVAVGAFVFVTAGALSLIDDNRKMSPAQYRWRESPFPKKPKTTDEAVALAQEQIKIGIASGQEGRFNAMGVALVFLAIGLLYHTFARFF
ncbi:hypothetical protein [Methylopila sp. M107]|uniref:hypothetical protein n=1 Tax=Methylopila sp. M107 TaxID=1101190 RepID=UPI00035DE281|nr:hypothetical protein [Methylopila sp. M107]